MDVDLLQQILENLLRATTAFPFGIANISARARIPTMQPKILYPNTKLQEVSTSRIVIKDLTPRSLAGAIYEVGIDAVID